MIKKNIKNSTEKLLNIFNTSINILFKNKDQIGTIRCVCFHTIKSEKNNSEGIFENYETHFDEFKEFTQYFIEHNYNFISPNDINENLNPEKKYILVTFDDGLSNTSLAANYYNRLGLKMTIFICPYYCVKQETPWDIIFIRELEKKRGDKKNKIRNQFDAIRQYNYGVREKIMYENFSDYKRLPYGDADRPLNFSELKQLINQGNIEIGNHSMHHTALTKLSNDELLIELESSQSTIKENLNICPQSFSFPFGYFNKDLINFCKDIGFKYVFTTVPEIVQLSSIKNDKPIVLGRFPAWGGKKNPFNTYFDKQNYYRKLRG